MADGDKTCPFQDNDGLRCTCMDYCALWDPGAEMCCLRVAARALARPQIITLVVPRDTDAESLNAYGEDLRNIVENVINEGNAAVLDAERKTKEKRDANTETNGGNVGG